MTFSFDAVLWGNDGTISWVFASLPAEVADDLADVGSKAGFGSIRVEVTVGSETWATSVFPDSKLGTYVLPVKRPIRKALNVDVGDDVLFALRVIDDDGQS